MEFFKGIIIVLLVTSCIDNSNKELENDEVVLRQVEKKANINDYFEVKFIVKVKENDNFQLFYSQDYFLGFSEEHSIITSFTGSDEYQKVIMKIPRKVFPVKYKFDIGSNINQINIKIKSLSISYREKEIYIPENKLLDFLVPNDCIEYNLTKSIFELKPYNNLNFAYDPYFTCSPKLIKILTDL